MSVLSGNEWLRPKQHIHINWLFFSKALTDTRLAVKNEWTSIDQESSKSALDLIYNAIRGTAETQIYREGK